MSADDYVAKIMAMGHVTRKSDRKMSPDDWTELARLLETDPDMFKKQ